jgi:hypothetical protein
MDSSLAGILKRLCSAFRIPSSDAVVLLFDGAGLTLEKGKLRRAVIVELESELREAGCGRGGIRLRKNGRVAFSGAIPVALHQRLRNLLLS